MSSVFHCHIGEIWSPDKTDNLSSCLDKRQKVLLHPEDIFPEAYVLKKEHVSKLVLDFFCFICQLASCKTKTVKSFF